jgi:SHAQKYF class myb-like DNA-binding protein
MEAGKKNSDINNNDYLLYYTKYNPYDLVNINNKDNNNDSMDLNEDENVNNNKSNGRWSQKEHLLFIKGCLLYGNYWKKVKKYIKTRSCSQIRSHAQKYLNKLYKKYFRNNQNNENNNFDLNIKLNEDEIKRLVNKNKFNEKEIKDVELHILSIFKNTKDKEPSVEQQDDNNNDSNNSNDNNTKKKIIKNKNKKIFNIIKVNKQKQKEEKFINIEIEENNKANNDMSDNDDNINEYSNNDNDNDNVNIKDFYDNNNNNDGDNRDKKILKENILADKRDMEILFQKEMFINKCLDSKDPKDLVKLLTFFGNDINFKVNDLKLLKKYQDYLGLDIDNSENNNDDININDNNGMKNNNTKEKEININNNICSINDNTIRNNNINIINPNQNMYPYLFNPTNNTIQFNPLYNPKLMINPTYMNQY